MDNNNKKSVFETLNAINVSGKTEKKNGLTYLSWAYAWAEVKKLYPTANYKVYERDTQWGPVNYFTDGRTAWVKVSVTIEGLEHVEMLPIMDYRNKAIPLDKVTSYDANKTIQRAITKAIARQGLGLYVYAGKDLPESQSTSPAQPAQQPANKPVEKAVQAQAPAQKPARDTRPVSVNEIKTIRQQVLNKYGIDEEWICRKYKAHNLQDLKMYQYQHILNNTEKLKSIFAAEKKAEKQQQLIDIVAQSKQAQAAAKTELTFNDAICPSQPKKEEDGEPIDLKSLGLTEKDIQALTDLGKVFN